MLIIINTCNHNKSMITFLFSYTCKKKGSVTLSSKPKVV